MTEEIFNPIYRIEEDLSLRLYVPSEEDSEKQEE